MKLEQLIQRVQSLYSRGAQSDDSRLTQRHIYNKLQSSRALLITQKANKKQKISDWSYQVLPCIELIDVPIHDCPCIPISDCTVKRSKYPLPKPLINLNSQMINYILSLDDKIKFDETSRLEYRYSDGNKYTRYNPKYIIDGEGYGYFYAKIVPKVVKMRFVAEDPVAAFTYPSYCGDIDGCDRSNPFSMEFPIDPDLIDVTIDFAIKELIIFFRQNPQDTQNDTTDDSPQTQQQ